MILLVLKTIFLIDQVEFATSQLASAIIPVYNAPVFDDSVESWKPLVEAKTQFPQVEGWVVGTVPKNDSRKRYQDAYKKFLGVGLNIICYVNTAHATIPIQEIIYNIDRCREFYGTFFTFPTNRTGIFFDNTHNGLKDSSQARPSQFQGDVPMFYKTISTYAKQKGMTMTVGNSNSYVDEGMIGALDVFNVVEANYGFPERSRYEPTARKYQKMYPISKWSGIINNVMESGLDPEKIKVAKTYLKYVWVTELQRKPPAEYNPYKVPHYAPLLFKYLSK